MGLGVWPSASVGFKPWIFRFWKRPTIPLCYSSPLYIDHLNYTKDSIIAFLDYGLTNLVDSYFKTAHRISNEHSLKTIYISYIHSYLNYANIAWACTCATKLKKINLLKNRAVPFVFNEGRLSHSRPLLRKMNALNVYQINFYRYLNFMCKVNSQETPRIFNDLIKKPVHKYPTNFSKSNICLKNVL